MKRLILYISLLATATSCSKFTDINKHTLNIYSNEQIASLDPALITDRYSIIVVNNIYEGLYGYHYLKHTIIPVLADGFPEQESELSYKIRLRQGIFFADDPCFKSTNGKGRELVAEDFVYSIKRLLASKNSKDIVANIDAVDKYTIQIELKKPSSFFPDVFTLPNTFIVPKEAVEYYSNNFSKHPVGTGPYKLGENKNENEYVLIKNSNYHHGVYPSSGEADDAKKGLTKYAGKNLPLVDRVVIKIITDEKERWNSFKEGKIDIVTLDKDSYFDAFPVGEKFSEKLAKKGIKVHKITELDVKYIGFNMSDKIVGKNKYLRQAISLAYDGYKHASLFFNNEAVVANWIIPPRLFGYDPSYENPYRRQSLRKAKELLAKAGYPNGKGLPTLTLCTLDSTAAKQIGEFFAKSLKEIGINIKLVPYDFPSLLKEMNSRKGYQLATLQWRADLPFAEDFLRILYGKAMSPGPNRTLFNNKQYNDLYEKVLTMKDSPEKLQYLNKMRDIAVEECPLIPLVVPYRIVLTQPYVKNYKPAPLDDYDPKYIEIDK